MRLVSYDINTGELFYQCEKCKNVSLLKQNKDQIINYIDDNTCVLNDGINLSCQFCDNIHYFDTPLSDKTTLEFIYCPKCKSNQIQVLKRGWSLTTGLLGSNKIERVCVNCKHRF